MELLLGFGLALVFLLFPDVIWVLATNNDERELPKSFYWQMRAIGLIGVIGFGIPLISRLS